MSESAALLRIEQPARAGARMAYEAARIAARLAGLLGDGSPNAAFLRTMEELSEGAPPKGRHRLDRAWRSQLRLDGRGWHSVQTRRHRCAGR